MTVFFAGVEQRRGALRATRPAARRSAAVQAIAGVPRHVHRRDDFSVVRSCQSLGQLMWATPSRPRAVRQAASASALRMPRAHDLLVEDGDVLEQAEQVDFLLVAHPHQVVIGLAGDRQDGGAVHLGVVEAVSRWIAPGPLVAMQTPSRPVNLA